MRIDQNKWVWAFFPIIAMAGLIFIQPNLSMVILLGMTTVVMYMVAGGSMKLFLSCVGTMFVTLVIGLTTIIKPYQLQRLKTWRHPESDPLGAGYNIIQAGSVTVALSKNFLIFRNVILTSFLQ